MSSGRVLTATVAVLCVLAIGVSATTLESSVGTDPDEAIDIEWDRLPIGEGQAAEIQQEVQRAGSAGSSGEGRATEDTQLPQRTGSGDSTGAASDDPSSEPQSRAASAEGDGAGTAGTGSRASQGGTGSGGAVPDRPPWNLLWLLAGVALLLVAATVGIWYIRGEDASGGPPVRADDSPPWPPEGDLTEVDRAWLAVVQRLDLDRPWTKTPAEVEAAAREAGMDPEGVEAVTAAFAEVHYAGAPVTEPRLERARMGLSRLEIAIGRSLA